MTEIFHDRREPPKVKLTSYQTKVLGHLNDQPHTGRTMAEKLHGEDVILSGQQLRRASTALWDLTRKGLGPVHRPGLRKKMSLYDYQAKVLNVHDGDTVTLDVDLGFNVWRSDNFRLDGINAPELATQEGKDALAFLLTQVKVGDTIEVKTIKDTREKYGRYLGVLLVNGVNINDLMVSSGHAVPYSGGKR